MTRAATDVAEIAGVRVEYRLRRGGDDRPYVVLPGAHMHAGCPFGEEHWLPPGRTELVVSRPGYGRTAVAAGRTPAAFAATVAELCRQLGLTDITALGISMGARTALALAADHPRLVGRLVLTCGVSFLPWPTGSGRRSALAMFNPVLEAGTWALLRAGLRHRPDRFLALGLDGLSTLPGVEVVARLGADRPAVVEFLRRCRSRLGFVTDLGDPGPDPGPRVRRPTLILVSRLDGSVPAAHPAHLIATVPGAEAVEVDAPSHLLWWGDHAADYAAALAAFDRRAPGPGAR